MKSLYDLELNAADGTPDFLKKYKGKVTMLVNTTVGCGNANQMEVLEWLHQKYKDRGFEIVALPTNDYCGPGVTKGAWSQGLVEGKDSQDYGCDVYGTTFGFSEKVKAMAKLENASCELITAQIEQEISMISDELEKLIESGKVSIILQPESKQKAEESKKSNKKSAKIEDKEIIAEPQSVEETAVTQVEEEVSTPSEENKIVETVQDEAINIVSESQNSDSL